LSLGRHVAIKVLPTHALLDPRQLGRFQREARSAAKLHHTNIVPVFGVGEQDGLHYYVMQFIPGLSLDEVLNELKRLGPGEKGEIRIKGPNVTKGYWNTPAETAAAFADGYLLTGDIGYMDEDGYFYLVDRKKDMIISGGFNVYPRAIEEAIYEHPAVAEVIVIGVTDAYRGEAAKAFVQLKVGAGRFTLDELRAFLADKLGRHEMPAHLEFRDTLPKTAVGKLSKKELIAEERQKMQAAAE